MLRLTTLGQIDLTRDNGTPIDSVLQQPKRLALLAYLAIEGGPTRRQALTAMFWPEADEASARQRLKQACYYLRQSLDASTLVTGPADHIGLAARTLPLHLDCTRLVAVRIDDLLVHYLEVFDLQDFDALPLSCEAEAREFQVHEGGNHVQAYRVDFGSARTGGGDGMGTVPADLHGPRGVPRP